LAILILAIFHIGIFKKLLSKKAQEKAKKFYFNHQEDFNSFNNLKTLL
jgi:hypothetical protein